MMDSKKVHRLINYNTLVFFIIVLFFFSGHFINAKIPYENFSLLQCLIIINFIACFLTLKKIDRSLKTIINSQKTDDCVKNKIKRCYLLLNSKYILFFSFVLAIMSNAEFFYLKLIPTNLMGIYIALLLFFVLSISYIGYIKYIIYIIFLKKISICEISYYNFFEPVRTPFIEILNHIIDNFSICFLLMGLIYTIVYSMIAPFSNIFLQKSFNFDMINMYEFIFIFSWLVIVILILIAFFILLIYPKVLLKRIIINLKDASKDTILLYLFNLSDKMKNDGKIELIERCLNIIKLIDSTKINIDKEKTIFIFSFFITMASLYIWVSSILNAFVQIQDIFTILF